MLVYIPVVQAPPPPKGGGAPMAAGSWDSSWERGGSSAGRGCLPVAPEEFVDPTAPNRGKGGRGRGRGSGTREQAALSQRGRGRGGQGRVSRWRCLRTPRSPQMKKWRKGMNRSRKPVQEMQKRRSL
eukprot:1158081-Pelagomonas_calceolata.AAC.6